MRMTLGHGVAALAVALTATLLGPAASVSAAPGGLEYSRDGVSWTSATPAGVFDTAPVLVPGGAATSTWRIRNAHGTPARFTAVVTSLHWSSAAAAGVFRIAAQDQNGAGLAATPVGSIGSCTAVVPQRVLRPGESVTVTVTVDIPSSVGGSTGMGESMGFALALSLADPGATVGAAGCPSGAAVIPMAPGAGGTGPGEAAAGGTASGTPAEVDEGDARDYEHNLEGWGALAEDWVRCGTALAAAVITGTSSVPCRDAFSNDGAAFFVVGMFVLVAILWFLLFWRRRRRDDEEDEAPADGGAR